MAMGDTATTRPSQTAGADSAPRRIAWLDAARGIGILLVIVGHALARGFVFDVIYAFHMPLFFFLSGVVSPSALNIPLAAQARRLARSLLAPFAFFGLVTLGYHAAMQRVVAGSSPGLQDVLSWAGAIAYGIGERMPSNWTLWFFPCLFVTILGSLASVRALGASRAFAATAILAVLAVLAPLPWRLPWSADSALVAALFFQAGMRFGAWPEGDTAGSLLPGTLAWRLVAAGLTFAVTAAVAWLNGTVDLARFVFGNPVIYAVGAASGIAGTVFLAQALPPSTALRHLSEDSRVIFPLHTLVFGLLTGAATRLFLLDRTVARDSMASVVVYVVVALAVTLAAAPLLRRLAPWAIGEQPRRRAQASVSATLQVVQPRHENRRGT